MTPWLAFIPDIAIVLTVLSLMYTAALRRGHLVRYTTLDDLVRGLREADALHALPDGIERMGGIDFDHAVTEVVRRLSLGARLLAQPYTSAALEVTLGGLSVRARGDVLLALTGAPSPADVDGRGVGYCGPFALADGQVLTLGTPPVGLPSDGDPLEAVRQFLIQGFIEVKVVDQLWPLLYAPIVVTLAILAVLFLYAAPRLGLEGGSGPSVARASGGSEG